MKIKTILFLPLLLLTAFVPILAQTDEEVEENPVILYSGTPKRYEIADITVKGDDQNVQTLKNLSGLVVGQRIAVPGPEISNAMKRLWRNGLFSNVRILATKISGDKIWLEIELSIGRNSRGGFHGLKRRNDLLEEKLKLVQFR